MKAKLLFGTGMAAGFLLGSRSGRAAYEKIKARVVGFWDSGARTGVTAAETDVPAAAGTATNTNPDRAAG